MGRGRGRGGERREERGREERGKEDEGKYLSHRECHVECREQSKNV